VNGMDGHLRELLEAAVGEPPHRVSVEAVRRRVIRRRVAEAVAVAVTVAVIAVIVPVGIGALGRPSGPPNGPAAARTVTSRQYGYTEALPGGWRSVRQAAQRWNGQGSPGNGDPAASRHWRFRHQRERVWRPTRPRSSGPPTPTTPAR